jgi:hypothetical protein
MVSNAYFRLLLKRTTPHNGFTASSRKTGGGSLAPLLPRLRTAGRIVTPITKTRFTYPLLSQLKFKRSTRFRQFFFLNLLLILQRPGLSSSRGRADLGPGAYVVAVYSATTGYTYFHTLCLSTVHTTSTYKKLTSCFYKDFDSPWHSNWLALTDYAIAGALRLNSTKTS